MVGWIKRFIYNCRKKDNLKSSELDSHEIEMAERTFIKLIQEEMFCGVEDTRLTFQRFWTIETPNKDNRAAGYRRFLFAYDFASKHPMVKD
ncbi:hypothetical protein JTB14_037901 [Gonioctena quinquepunctata]|nr:hypothetical protein JTB14_037901 [Gonioctena quinquepunctata]